jgi:hypothetical protein
MDMILTNQNYHTAALQCGLVTLALACTLGSTSAGAQVVETVGSRALGMGGAFVAVANDSSATWWNPAALAAGPYVDLAWARDTLQRADTLPAARHRTSWFAVTTPPFGFSYYRFRITDIQPFDPTGEDADGRQDRRAGVPVRSLSASQVGVTLVNTVISGVHTGTTLKYVRGTLRHGHEDSGAAPSDLLDAGDAYEGGESSGGFDLDAGVLAVAGPVRLGVVVRNLRQREFEAAGLAPEAPPVVMRLSRQIRVGAAFDAVAANDVPLTVALDADVRAYETASGARRVVAAGAEYWLFTRRIGLRGGGRVNTAGDRERTATAGVSVAARGGLFVDGHVVRGGSGGEEGWGVAARISF